MRLLRPANSKIQGKKQEKKPTVMPAAGATLVKRRQLLPVAMTHPWPVSSRTEIFTGGSFNDQTRTGGWAAVIARTTSGRQHDTSRYEMDLRTIVEAAKLAEGFCAIVFDHVSIIGVAQRGMTPRVCRPLWEKL